MSQKRYYHSIQTPRQNEQIFEEKKTFISQQTNKIFRQTEIYFFFAIEKKAKKTATQTEVIG